MTRSEDRARIVIDEEHPTDEEGHVWGYISWDGTEQMERPMDEIIIQLANNASAPGGPKAGGRHYTWLAPDPLEEPKRA